jgi:hypothetical protein
MARPVVNPILCMPNTDVYSTMVLNLMLFDYFLNIKAAAKNRLESSPAAGSNKPFDDINDKKPRFDLDNRGLLLEVDDDTGRLAYYQFNL